MITYKTSDLFRRAKQLADLEGTDFITWNEAINCINESYIGLYEKLINMGDNSFVESFHTKETEIELSKDFWQLKGVYLWNNGNLQTINRRADNNGIHHTSYELRNGKLYIFGNPNEVVVEYYKKPKTLYMPTPDKEIDLSGIPEGAKLVDCYGHLILYSLKVGNNYTLNIYDIDGVKSATDIFNSEQHINFEWCRMSEDTVITQYDYNDQYFMIYDITLGETISSTLIKEVAGEFLGIEIPAETIIFPLIVEGKKFYWIFQIEDTFYVFDNLTPCTSFKTDKLNFNTPLFTESSEVVIYTNSSYSNFWESFRASGSNGYIIHNGVVLFKFNDDFTYANDRAYCLNVSEFISIDADPKVNITAESLDPQYGYVKYGVLEKNSYVTVSQKIGECVGIASINEVTGYGYITKKYGKYYVSSWCEDTVLDFPNSFYFQMLSYLLAIAFRSKQGADITLLSSQLAMVSQTFEDTLGSDNFQYPRMGNVYN